MKRMLSMLALLGAYLLLPLVLKGQDEYLITFEPVEHCTITASYGNGASAVDVQSGDKVPSWTYLTIRATPEEGYMVTHYILNGVAQENTGSSISQMVSEDLTISARIVEVRPCTVTIVQPEHGSIQEQAVREVTSGDQVDSGTKLRMEVTPEEGYEIECWIINGKKVLPNATGDFHNIFYHLLQDDVTLSAQMKVAGTTTLVPITIDNPEHGSIKAYNGAGTYYPELLSGEEVEIGKSIALEITPEDLYQLDYWLINGERVDKETGYFPNEKVIQIVEATTISAVLKEAGYLVTYEQPEHGILEVTTGYPAKSVASGSRVAERTNLTIEATVEKGYLFKHFIVNGEIKVPSSLAYPYIMITAQTDLEIEAVIEEPQPCIVTIEPFEHGVINVQYGSYFSPTIVSSGDEVPAGTQLTIEASLDPGYKLKHYLINGEPKVSTSTYSDAIYYTVQGPVTIGVVVEEAPGHVVTIEPFDHGSLKVEYGNYPSYTTVTSGDEVPEGTKLTVDAYLDDGYVLDHFLVNGEARPSDSEAYDYIVVTVTEPMTISAVAKADGYNVTYAQPEHGKLTVIARINGEDTEIASGTSVANGTFLTVQATVDEGYAFLHFLVNDEIMQAPFLDFPSISFTVESDVEIEAVIDIPKLHVVTIEPFDHGSLFVQYGDFFDPITVVSGDEVPEGTLMDVMANLDEGYDLDHFLINGVSKPADNPDFASIQVVVTGPMVITAVAKPHDTPQPTGGEITMIQPPAGQGTMTAYYLGGGSFVDVVDGDNVPIGASVNFSVLPAEGYEMDYWMINDVRTELELSSPNEKSITVEGDLKVEPILKSTTPSTQATVTLQSQGTGGYVMGKFKEPNATNDRSLFVDMPQTMEIGSTVQITANVTPGFVVTFTHNGLSVPAETLSEDGLVYTFTVEGDSRVMATFAQKEIPAEEYTVTYTAGVGGSVTATADMEPFESGSQVMGGQTIKLTAQPDPDYVVDQWILNEKVQSSVAGQSSFIFVLEGETTIEVTFKSTKPVEYTVTLQPVLPSASAGTAQLFYSDGVPFDSGTAILSGTEMYVEVKAADKYELETLKVNSTTLKLGDEALVKIVGGGYKYSFMVTEATTVQATFKLSGSVEGVASDRLSVYVTDGGSRLEIKGATEGAEMRLFDYMGQLLLASQEHTIDISALPAGSYILLVGDYTTRIVK